MQFSEQPPQQPPEGTPSQPFYPQGTPSQPLPPPPPYSTQPYPAQPFPPQGQWPGAMPPPQMPPQAPKKRSKLIWILGGVIAVVLVCCIAGIAVVANGSKNSPNNTASNPTTVSTSAPTTVPTQKPSAGHHKVGDTISTATWQVTINTASVYAGDPNQFEVPKDGDTFLVVEGTFKNLTSQSQTLSTLVFFELQDAQGNKYNDALLTSVTPPDGAVLANGPAHGKWGYEVPTNTHAFVLVFTDDFGQTTYVWDISI